MDLQHPVLEDVLIVSYAGLALNLEERSLRTTVGGGDPGLARGFL